MSYDTKQCFSRLPCGLCRLTKEMCPFEHDDSNYNYPTCYDPGYLHKDTTTVSTSESVTLRDGESV